MSNKDDIWLGKKAASRSRDPWFDEDAQATRSYRWAALIALVATLSVNSVIIYGYSQVEFSKPRSDENRKRQYTIAFSQSSPQKVEEFKEKPKPPPEFLEANPEANDERPKEAIAESFMNQRAAQENPDKSQDAALPTVEGERKSQKIVDGDLNPVLPQFRPGSPVKAEKGQEQESDAPASKQGPEPIPELTFDGLPAIDIITISPLSVPKSKDTELQPDVPSKLEDKPDKLDGPLASESPSETLEEQKVPENRVVKDEDPAYREKPEWQQKQTPEPDDQTGQFGVRNRPKVKPRVPTGPLRSQLSVAGRSGTLAMDVKHSEFGAYNQSMMEVISRHWHLLIGQAKSLNHGWRSFRTGNIVTVRFVIQSDGSLKELNTARTTGSTEETLIVLKAIRSGAPYPAFTSEMVNTVGEENTFTINFLY